MRTFFQHYGRLLRYLKPYQIQLSFLLLFSAIFAIASNGRILAVKVIIDDILPGRDLTMLWTAGFFIAVAAILISVSELLSIYLRRYIMWKVIVDLRIDLCENLIGSSMEFFNREKQGELLSRMNNDINATQKAILIVLADLIQSPLLIGTALAGCLHISPKLTMVVFLLFPVLVGPLYLFGRKIKKASRKSLSKMADTTEAMLQIFTGIRTVKTFRMEDQEMDEFKELNRGFLKRTLKMVKARALSNSFTSLMSNGMMAALVVGAGYMIIQGHMALSVGDLITFCAMLAMMYKPIKGLTKGYNNIQEALAGAERVFELIDSKPVVKNAPKAFRLEPIREHLRFHNVSFAYDTAPVLHGIELTINQGETVAIVGPSGAGKSSLLDLVPRFYDPTEGAVTIDGHDLKAVTLESVRDQVAIVSQDPFLFHDTVFNNILYGLRGADKAAVLEAAKSAHVDEFIDSLPNGYQTVVGERGVMLSGGQRQRLTIARAILKNAPILILDEATSSLDSASERAVQDALNQLMTGRTTLAIAHRISTIQSADRIVVLNQGRIIDTGRHEELLGRCNLYKKMCELQFADDPISTRRT